MRRVFVAQKIGAKNVSKNATAVTKMLLRLIFFLIFLIFLSGEHWIVFE